jgi:hypothetical protein
MAIMELLNHKCKGMKMIKCVACNNEYDDLEYVSHLCITTGRKDDSSKIRMDLLPFDSLEEISKVLTFGAKKYAPNNWKFVENPVERYEAAMLRHISAYKQGELLDSETGLPHLAHAACCLMFLISFTTKE